MAPKLSPRDTVGCDRFAGHARIPAETCAMRTLIQDEEYGELSPVYPQCATCPVGASRRSELESGGWVFDAGGLAARTRAKRKAEKAARRRIRRTVPDASKDPDRES